MVIFGGTVRCAHCIIHGRLFETLLGIILVTLGFILVALGSILVTLGTPGNLRGTLCDQWQDFFGNLRFLGIPPGTHVSTFSAKNSDARGHRPETRDHRPDTLGGQIPEARHPEATGQKPEPTLY